MLYKGAGYRRQELFVSIIDKILRAGEGRMLRKLDRLASQVDAMQEDFEALTDGFASTVPLRAALPASAQ